MLGRRLPTAARTVTEWRGDDARKLRAVLERAHAYPHCHLYRYWPGPNSNTYAAWALRKAGLAHDLDPRAFGKDFPGLIGAALQRLPRILAAPSGRRNTRRW